MPRRPRRRYVPDEEPRLSLLRPPSNEPRAQSNLEKRITITSVRDGSAQIHTRTDEQLDQMSQDDRRSMLNEIIRQVYQVARKYELTNIGKL